MSMFNSWGRARATGVSHPGAPELLRATISSTSRSEPHLIVMRMIKRLFRLLMMMIIITIYDEISAITKCVGGDRCIAKGSVYPSRWQYGTHSKLPTRKNFSPGGGCHIASKRDSQRGSVYSRTLSAYMTNVNSNVRYSALLLFMTA